MDRRKFQKQLLDWYEAHGRPLPWRQSHDPYSIWISEIMLQQTTVAAVIPYFERFMARFPTVQALASAPEADVLKHWEGLGYYSRARNLHKAAQLLVERHGGAFPRDVEQLLALPGIGRYTAGAIASFAFDLPAPIVEANTQRLYARLTGYDGELKSAAGQKVLWGFAEEIVDCKTPGLINQAVMELGSLVCRPLNPACDNCPVAAHCVAYRESRQHEIPRAGARLVITPQSDTTLLLEHEGKLFLRQREKPERWAGLWDFPRYTLPEEVVGKGEAAYSLELASYVREQLGWTPPRPTMFSRLTHGVTRYRITLHAYWCELAPGVSKAKTSAAIAQLGSQGKWYSTTELDALAVPVTTRKLIHQWQKLKKMP